MVDATGTRRRLRGMGVLGLDCAWLAPRVAMTVAGLHSLRAGRTRRVHATVAAAVTRLADQLIRDGAQPIDGPPGSAPMIVRRWARRQRWAPLLAWDNPDDPTEEPKHQARDAGQISESELALLLLGKLPPSQTHFRARHNQLAVPILAKRGLATHQIAARLKISDRAVLRILSRTKEVAA